MLLEVSSAASDTALTVLWKELPSAEPILYLMPENIIEKYLQSDGCWHFVSQPMFLDIYNPLSILEVFKPSFAITNRVF